MSRVDEKGNQYFGADDSREFLFSVNGGFLKSYKQIRAYGFNPDLDTGTNEYVWDVGVEPTYDTVNKDIYIVSSSASDTHEIMVNGLTEDLDGNWNEASEVAILNGITPVLLNTKFIRITSANNDNGVNLVGNVYVTTTNALPIADTDVNIRAKINIGEETTHMAMFTVPSGYSAFIYRLYNGVRRNEDAVFNFQFREFGKVFRSMGKVTSYQSSQQLQLGFERFTEKTDLRVKVSTLTNNTEAYASMHMILVSNKNLTGL